MIDHLCYVINAALLLSFHSFTEGELFWYFTNLQKNIKGGREKSLILKNEANTRHLVFEAHAECLLKILKNTLSVRLQFV
jgi:hypothetical protein